MNHLPNIVKEFKIYRNSYFKTLYRNGLDEACFDHDAVYSEKRDLAEGTISDKTAR